MLYGLTKLYLSLIHISILSDTQLPQKVGELAMFDADLLRLLGHIPNEYLYYYYYRDKASGNIHQAGTTRGISVEENNIQMLKELSALDLESCAEEAERIYPVSYTHLDVYKRQIYHRKKK